LKAQAAADFQTVEVGQHYVEQQQIEGFARGEGKRAFAVFFALRRVTGFLHRIAQHARNTGIIFDNEYSHEEQFMFCPAPRPEKTFRLASGFFQQGAR
jgi:hypothetical protein